MAARDLDAVTLHAAGAAHASLLEELLERYCGELSGLFGIEPGPDGKYAYPALPRYWSEPDTHHAFLLHHGPEVAGFVFVQAGSPFPEVDADFDVAEFFVVPAHRRAGVGRRAAFEAWDRFPGRWMVRVADGNAAAVAFWTSIIDAYTGGAFGNTRCTSHERDWHVFTFESRRAVR